MASRNFLKKGLIVSSLLLILWVSGYSQNIPLEEKHALLNNYKTALEDTINKRVEMDRPFVLGRMQAFHGTSVHHPYFSDYHPVNGSLVFKNKSYEADALLYDIHNDKLVYRYYSSNFNINSIALDENFVLGFTIHNSVFRYFKGLKTKSGRNLKDGYYEVVYDGKLKFLIRWEKTESFDVNEAHKFSVLKRMYMLNGAGVVGIKNKWQLMSKFADKKREVKKFIKQNHIILNLKDSSSVNEVFEYYESLF